MRYIIWPYYVSENAHLYTDQQNLLFFCNRQSDQHVSLNRVWLSVYYLARQATLLSISVFFRKLHTVSLFGIGSYRCFYAQDSYM